MFSIVLSGVLAICGISYYKTGKMPDLSLAAFGFGQPEKVASLAPAAQVCAPPGAPGTSYLTHFGQPLRLNGANLAWSQDVLYARDVGTNQFDISMFRKRFAAIAQAGGNSARWWLHTNGTVTPSMNDAGMVTGLSRNMSDAGVVDQMRQVLDVAWSYGVVVNITLFSFDLMCEGANPRKAERMLNRYHKTYLDKALTPMVRGLKDHPALFAWEIFNEAEGMSHGTAFFGDPNLQNCATGKAQPKWVFQRFVNHAAAHIHALDPNVKVTTSVGHPKHYEDYTNRALLSQRFSVPSGGLDFYQIHWYAGERNPFVMPASQYRPDRPIVLGEFGYGLDGESQTPADKLGLKALQQGYVGSWIWSQTSVAPANVSKVIRAAATCAPRLNKAAIETCIRTKNPTCYR